MSRNQDARPELHDLADEHTAELFSVAWDHLNPKQLVNCLVEDQIRRISSQKFLKVEEYLERFPQLGNERELLADLVYNEFLLLSEMGQEADIAQFKSRFPDLSDILENQFQVFQCLMDHAESVDEAVDESDVFFDPDNSPVIARRYEIEKQIGQGGFSDVYIALDKKLNREVAIKIARATFQSESRFAKRFAREAETAARLAHPGVVQVYEFGEHHGRPYIVEQLLENGTLAEKIEKHPEIETGVRWLIDVCEAIDYAHQLDVVHRDIKPSNILFDRSNQPRVADFGLAWIEDVNQSLTAQGDLLGTPAYMSPEQVNGSQVGPATDIYSLGVVLYQLLCGRLPFQGNTSSVLRQIVFTEAPNPKTYNKNVHRDLQVICEKAMSKSPQHRYESAREMADDLRRFLASEPVHARSPGLLFKLQRWCQRQPALAATILVSFVLLMTLSIGSYSRISSDRNRLREQRDLAQAREFTALLKAAESDIRSKRLGWYASAVDSIREASRLPVQKKDLQKLRELYIEALGYTTPRLELAATSQGQGSPVSSIDVVEARSVIVVANSNGQVHVVDEGSLFVLCELVGPAEKVEKIQADPNSQFVVGLSAGQIWRWDLSQLNNDINRRQTDRTPLKVKGMLFETRRVSAIGLSHNGRLLGIGYSGGGFEVRQATSLAKDSPSVQVDTDSVEISCIDFASDNSIVACGMADGYIGFWDTQTGILKDLKSASLSQSILTISAPATCLWSDGVSYRFGLIHHGDQQQSPRLSGKVVEVSILNDLAIVGTADGRVHVARINPEANPEIIASTDGFGELTSIATSTDGNVILAGYADGSIRKWQITTSQFVTEFPSVQPVAVGKDDKFYCENFVIDPNRVAHKLRLAQGENSGAIAVGPVSGVLVCVKSSGLELLDPITRKVKKRPISHLSLIESIAFSEDETILATADRSGTIRTWTYPDCELLQKYKLEHGQLHEIQLTSGFLVASGNHGVTAIDLESGKTTEISDHKQLNGCIAVANRMLAHSEKAGSIVIRESGSWKELTRLTGSADRILSLQFFDKGSLASLSADGTLRIWNVDNKKEQKRIAVEKGQNRFCIDPEMQFIVTTNGENNSNGMIWDYETGGLIGRLELTAGCFDIAMSNDGSKVWLANSGVFEFDREDLELAFHKRSTADNRLTIDVPFSFRWAIPGNHIAHAWSCSLSPDEQWVVTTGFDRQVRVWARKNDFNLHRMLPGHTDDVWCSAFSPDSSILATGSSSKENGEVILWDTQSWQPIRNISSGSMLVSSVSFHPTKPWLVVSNFDGSAQLVDWTTGEVVHDLLPQGADAMDAAFSDNGKWLAIARTSSGLAVWSEKELASNTKPKAFFINDSQERVWALAFANSGKQLATATESGAIRFYSIPDWELTVTIKTGTTNFRRMQFTQDDEFLALSAFSLTKGQIWNLDKLRSALRELGLDWQ